MNYLIITKKALVTILLVAALTLTALTAFVGLVAPTHATKRKLPIYSVETTDKKVALTFDCAWENSDTDILLKILSTSNIKATFFVTGDFCSRYPDDIKKIAQAGHSVQNHSYTHPHVENISPEKLIADTKACDEIITNLTGVVPTLYRAPYGEYSDSMLTVFEQDLKHQVIQWSCDSVDWKGKTAEAMVNTVLAKANEGGIILFHNDTKNTPQAIEQVIPALTSKGYSFVLVQDLIYKDNYTIDHTGRQIRTVLD